MSIYDDVTKQISDQLKSGVRPWTKPFNGGYLSMPLRHNGQAYQGINILLLWMQEQEQPIWMTYIQAKLLGGQVRKGSKATRIIYYGVGQDKENDVKNFTFVKSYPVFNVSQITGLPDQYYTKPVEPFVNTDKIDGSVMAWRCRTGADIVEGNKAYYRPSTDQIGMPPFKEFRSALDYYSTLYHEFIHWTGAEHRLDRLEMQNKKAYAFEELVAEMGAAFLMAQFGYEPTVREDHAQYINHWIDALDNDKKFIFQAATAASKAVEYLNHTTQQQLEAAQ